MKASISSKDSTTRPYPKLMQYNKWGDTTKFTVLFTSPDEGTVVHTGNSARQLGSYSTEWRGEVFTDFVGSVTLETE